MATPAIRALIRDDKIHQIYSPMQAGKKFGMQTMNDALYQLYMNARSRARRSASASRGDPNEFLRMIGEKPMEEQDMGAMADGKAARQPRRWRR